MIVWATPSEALLSNKSILPERSNDEDGERNRPETADRASEATTTRSQSESWPCRGPQGRGAASSLTYQYPWDGRRV
jgi:hypothetical protein